MISIAWAQDGSGGTMESFGVLLPLILVFVVFYFLLIRPQQKKVKEHQSKLSSIVKGDEILTGGGIYGKVTKADDKDLMVKIGDGVEIKVLRASVMDKLEKGSIKNLSTGTSKTKKKSKTSEAREQSQDDTQTSSQESDKHNQTSETKAPSQGDTQETSETKEPSQDDTQETPQESDKHNQTSEAEEQSQDETQKSSEKT